jgi:site-specific recombinase XerD
MMWDYWIALYTRTHCTARGLRIRTIAAYDATLRQFRDYVRLTHAGLPPDQVTPRIVLEYLEHLRRDRDNGDSAINRALVVIRGFYCAVVAMGHLEHAANPIVGFPTIKAVPRKLPAVLTEEETEQLLNAPRADTVIGLRDRALLTLLYGTGIRASECAGLRHGDVDLIAATIRVTGKGGHDRTIPLNARVLERLRVYMNVRGAGLPSAPVFVSRKHRAMTRGAIYERVRRHARRARIAKHVSPHRLRHTFATHLVRAGVGLVTIRDLLGHRLITSTQIYLHVTAQDLRAAADRHPIARLLPTVEHLLPTARIPFEIHARRRRTS